MGLMHRAARIRVVALLCVGAAALDLLTSDVEMWMAVAIVVPAFALVLFSVVAKDTEPNHRFSIWAGTAVSVGCILLAGWGGLYFLPATFLVVISGLIPATEESGQSI